MASIPFYIIVGDRQLNGPGGIGLAPQPGNQGKFWTNFRNKPLLMQTVPTTGSAYLPWWDGTAGTQLVTNAATSNTVTVTTTPWTTNSEVGKYVTVDDAGGTAGGVSQRKLIVSNTANQLTISGTWTTPPTASVIHVNDGAWVVYDHVRGADNPLKVNNGNEGDNWYANQAGGFGFTTSLMQLLKARHPSGFKVYKRAALGGTDDWAAGGTNQNTIAAELAEAIAAMAPDTPDYKGVIYWNSTDISEENLSYVANAISFCAAIRSLMGDTTASVPIWFVNNASQFLQVSNVTTIGALTDVPFAQVVRQANVALRGAVTNFHLLDMEGATFAADSVVDYATIDTDPQDYSTEDHLILGEDAYRAIVRYYADAPSGSSGVLPVVVMLGDSQGTGMVYPQYAILGGQEGMIGPTGTVRDGEWIWNDDEQAWELYDITANANTLGASGVLYYGPEAALLDRLRDEFPDGVAVFKMAKGGASVTTEGVVDGATDTFDPAAGTMWTELGTAWNAAKLALLRDTGLLPDVIGVFGVLGDNDSRSPSSSGAFATKLPIWKEQLRDRFATRSTGPTLGFAWHNPPQHVENGGQSILGTAAAKQAVRDALAAEAESDPRFVLLSDEGLDLLRDDDIHYSGRAQDTLGIRAAEAILTLNDATAGTSQAVSADPATETAAAQMDSALDTAPDIAGYTLPDGTSVQRRSADDLIKLERYQEAKSMRASRRIFRTTSRFNR